MSKRRLPKPKWHRYAGVAAAVAVIGTGAAVAASAGSGPGAKQAGSVAASQESGTAGALRSGASPTASASGTARPTGPAGRSARPSASASGTATAPAGAKAPAEGAPTSAPPSSGGSATPATVPGPPHPASAEVFTGLAFDTCTAPSASTMSAWKAGSPYGGVAVYVGGRNRGCSQPALTPSWVSATSAAGWKLIPIYVGAQPPCQTGGSPERISASTAASLGTSDGADAVGKAMSLGMRGGSAVYLDMEAFDAGDTACADAVLSYVQAWDKALHARGYWAGFYGFASSSASVVAKAEPATPDMPDVLWYARYDGNDSTTAGFPFSSGLWTGHRRGHQYQVDSKETHGGATITVDRDAWDAPVAVTG